jgi:thioredoxin-related protein
MVAPVLEDLSRNMTARSRYIKWIQKRAELASIFGIRSIPSILFIPMDGKPQMSTGAMPKEGFLQAINEILLVKAN